MMMIVAGRKRLQVSVYIAPESAIMMVRDTYARYVWIDRTFKLDIDMGLSFFSFRARERNAAIYYYYYMEQCLFVYGIDISLDSSLT